MAFAWSSTWARRSHEDTSRREGRRIIDRENISAENQSYTANTSIAKNPEFSETAAMISRVKVKIFTVFLVTLDGCIWDNLRILNWECWYSVLKFVSLNIFGFPAMLLCLKTNQIKESPLNHELFLLILILCKEKTKTHPIYFCF